MSSLLASEVLVMPLIDENHNKSDVVASSTNDFTVKDQQSFDQIAKLSSWDPDSNNNNSQCCNKLPVIFSQDATMTTTSSTTITSSSLHTSPSCPAQQLDSQNTNESMLLSPLLKKALESSTQFYSVTEKPTVDSTTESLTYMAIGSSGAQIQIRTRDLLSLTTPPSIDPQVNPSDQPDSTSSTSVSSKTQLNKHGFLSSIRPVLQPKSRASRSKKSKRNQCKCPNCADGGNKLRNMYGHLVHFCHIPGCTRVFSATGHLKRHMEWHNDPNGFVCPHCDKVYTRKDSLTRHLKIHTNVVPNEPKNHNVDTQISQNPVFMLPSLPQINIQDNNNNLVSALTVSQTASEALASIVVQSSETSPLVPTLARVFEMPIFVPEASTGINTSVLTANSISDKQVFVPTVSLETTLSIPMSASNENHLENSVHPASTSPDACETIHDQSTVQDSLVALPLTHSLKDSLSDLLIFKTKNTLQENCSADTSNKAMGLDDKLQYVCHIPDCKKVFNHKKSLKRHLVLHTGKSNFSCKYCSKVFTRKDTFNEHVRRHENSKQSELNNNHEFNHETTQRIIACHIVGCGKIYSSIGHLNVHLKQHHGIQPYVCTWPLCGEKFDLKLEFQKHVRMHAVEKNFICSYCNKECINDTKLKTHIYRIHENPKYKRP